MYTTSLFMNRKSHRICYHCTRMHRIAYLYYIYIVQKMPNEKCTSYIYYGVYTRNSLPKALARKKERHDKKYFCSIFSDKILHEKFSFFL